MCLDFVIQHILAELLSPFNFTFKSRTPTDFFVIIIYKIIDVLQSGCLDVPT